MCEISITKFETFSILMLGIGFAANLCVASNEGEDAEFI